MKHRNRRASGAQANPHSPIPSSPSELQADRRALNITLNSIGTELTRDDRRRLYANFGLLYPHGQVRGVWWRPGLAVLRGRAGALWSHTHYTHPHTSSGAG